jgi:prepilin-type N-terminal cleavage/methylation domain-containing protein
MNLTKKNKYNQGFTLIEVAMVMIIGGLIVAAFSAGLAIYIKNTQLKVTQKRLEAIDTALQNYLNQAGAYPCPARFQTALDNANFGVAVPNCSTTAPGGGDDTVRTASTRPGGTRDVRIGTVPVRTLNLPDDYVSDAWGGRFTYAVTEKLTSTTTYDRNEGGIKVVDSGGNDVIVYPAAAAGHYVVVSHGVNKSGAVPTAGGAPLTCTAGNEQENCDSDSTFLNTLLVNEGTNKFDDIVRARSVSPFGAAIPSGAIMAFDVPCPPGWAAYAAASGRFIVGSGTLGAQTYAASATGGSAFKSQAELGYQNGASPLKSGAFSGSGSTAFLQPLASGTPPFDMRPPYLALNYCRKN